MTVGTARQGAAVLLLPVILTGVAGAAVFNLAPLFLHAAAARFSLADSEIGWLLGVEIAGIALASFAMLLVARRVPPSRIALIGLVVIAIGNPLAGMVDQYPLFLAARFLIGLFGDGFAYVAAIMTLGRQAVPVRAFAVLSLANMGVGGVGLSLFAEAEQPTFTILFTAFAILGLLAWGRYPSADSAEETTLRPIGNPPGFKTTVLLAGLFAYALDLGAVWAYAERVGAWIGLDQADIGVLLGASVAFQAAGSATAIALAGRVAPTRVLWPVAAGQAAVLWLLATAAGPWGFLTAVAIWGFSWNVGIVQILGILANTAEHRGALALAPGTEALGAASGPLLVGTFLAIGGAMTVSLVAAMGAAIGVALSLAAARTTARESPPR